MYTNCGNKIKIKEQLWKKLRNITKKIGEQILQYT